ncbi:hypothetical protein Fcan01_20367 [Folsomia candida]|uniref:Uncharacterized protein n=1 Tax=Folsomia candida TaxID=158441 RepID=A0A226DIY0_FOLCA|nr:hypothetical protein Fcan01_20367 [Folsomia candida]
MDYKGMSKADLEKEKQLIEEERGKIDQSYRNAKAKLNLKYQNRRNPWNSKFEQVEKELEERDKSQSELAPKKPKIDADAPNPHWSGTLNLLAKTYSHRSENKVSTHDSLDTSGVKVRRGLPFLPVAKLKLAYQDRVWVPEAATLVKSGTSGTEESTPSSWDFSKGTGLKDPSPPEPEKKVTLSPKPSPSLDTPPDMELVVQGGEDLPKWGDDEPKQ